MANGSYGNGKHEDPIRYRASTDGGKTWLPERTLVASTADEGFNLQLGAAADGGGFVAYDRNNGGPLTAVAIPPLSAQGGGGSGGGADCVGTVSFGPVQAIATAGCLLKHADGSYTSSDPVRLNGLDLVPHASGRRAHAAAKPQITVDPVHKQVHIDAADVKAGNIVLDKGSFDWDLAKGAGTITTFTHLEKFKVSIFGFPVAGEATLQFDKNGAFIPAHLELPAVFGGITADVTLRLKNPGGLKLDGFKLHVGQAFLGALQVKPLDVEYKGSQPPVFEGSATFLLPPAYANPGAHVSFGFVNGQFKHAEGSVPFDPPLALAPPWAYLRQIGLALSTDPLKIGGGVELIGGPQILGSAALAIDALPPQGFSFTFSDPAHPEDLRFDEGRRHPVRQRLRRVPLQRAAEVRRRARLHRAAGPLQHHGRGAHGAAARPRVRRPLRRALQRPGRGRRVRPCRLRLHRHRQPRASSRPAASPPAGST